jgi:phage terminase large subunit-like protein
MMEHPCTQYAREVVEGDRVVGKSERLACKRHLDDLARQGADWPWVFDPARADIVYEFIGYCHHVEGELAGQPIVLAPFQKFDIGVIFGWVHKETGERRFNKALIFEARKNGKTALLAGVSLYLMVGDGEMNPRVFCAAVDRGQARIMYEAAMTMAKGSPEIGQRLDIRDYKISHAKRGGTLAPLSKDTKNKDGLHPSGAIIDEYHAHATSEIYDLLSSAEGGHRRQPLMVTITTAGMDTDSPCHKEYEYCKMILEDPELNQRYFVMIRELDPEDDEHKAENWVKSNPLRVLIPKSMKKLQEQHDEAFGSGDPAKIRTYRVKNLNVWLEGNEDTYMGDFMDRWDALGMEREKFYELTRGMLCLAGVDLSKKVDLTADAFVFALDKERVAVCAQGFIPEEAVKRHEKTDKIPYREWIRAGWVTTTEGAVVDYQKVEDHIAGVREAHGWQVHQICYDPYNATHFANEMAGKGFTMVETRQTMQNLNEPTKLFRELVATGRLVHDGSPLLKWCVRNAVQIVDSKENVMLSKRHAGDTKRIDLLAAVIDALRQLDELKKMAVLLGDDFGF